MKAYSFISFLLLIVFISACGQKTETKTAEAETEEHAEESNAVALSEEQINMAGIQIGLLEMKNITNSISVNGTLAVPNQNKALVTSLASGTLKSLNVQPGATVRKGQVIGTVVNTELSALQQQLVSVNAQISYTELELNRQRELVAGNAAPLKNLQRTESELKGLRAQQQALRRQLAALGIPSGGSISSVITLRAPISGTISEVSAQIGSQVDASSPIAQIIDNSELHLDLFVYEKDLGKIAKGQIIHFTLTNNPGKEYDAVMYSIGSAFVNETKAVPVHATVVNDKSGLIEGMNVTARISLGAGNYLAVPNDAIVDNGGRNYIFIVGEEGAEDHARDKSDTHQKAGMSFERIEIVKGVSDIGYTEIKPIKELTPGTRIVTKGAFFLMAKLTNSGGHDDH